MSIRLSINHVGPEKKKVENNICNIMTDNKFKYLIWELEGQVIMYSMI